MYSPEPEPEVVNSIMSLIVAVPIIWCLVSQRDSSTGKRGREPRLCLLRDLFHHTLIATQTPTIIIPTIHGTTCHADG